jgi:hypothetical protein
VIVRVLDGNPVPLVVFVNPHAEGPETGLSWMEAFHELESALTAVRERPGSEEIWVAAGMNRPTRRTIPLDPRSATFDMLDGVRIYGGFNGTETSPSQRDIATNVTTLSGDLAGDDHGDIFDQSRGENSYHVVRASDINTPSGLDGFIITSGIGTKVEPQENGKTGAGILTRGGSPTFSNCTITGNRAIGSGSGMDNSDGRWVRLYNCTFSDNEGGAISNSNTNLEITKCIIKSNSGSGVLQYGGLLSISHSEFLNNHAHSPESYSTSSGGAVCCFGDIAMIDDSVFEGNSADQCGAVLFAEMDTCTVTGCEFRDNQATKVDYWGDAGALLISGSELTSVGKCRFFANKAKGWGGALEIRDFGGQTSVADCIFEGNQGESGGGLFAQGWFDTLQILRCEFRTNRASQNGGGLCIAGEDQTKPEVIDCVFSGNTGYEGGGLNSWGASIRGCCFFQNGAIRGGGVHATESTLLNCVISGNRVTSTSGAGGGAHLSSGKLDNCVLSGNSSSTSGGGLYAVPDYWNARTEVLNCSLTGNIAGNSGGGIRVGAGTARIQNTILWNNSAAASTPLAAQVSGGTAVVDYSCIQGWDGSLGGIGNFSADPLFVNAVGIDGVPGTEDDDLHLSNGSPCANVGDNEAVASEQTDFESDPRIQGCRVDVGADETAQASLLDCNHNGKPDVCDIADQSSLDCDENGVPDECDIASGASPDSDGDGVPDSCEALRVYVNGKATGSDQGSTWADAFHDLQTALKVGAERPGPTEIWVAAGIYTPAPPVGDRAATFRLHSHTAVYGGFAGGEESLDQRDPLVHETILSGDLNGDDGPNFGNAADNSLHVVSAIDIDSNAVLDGFVVTGGRTPVCTVGSGSGLWIEYGSPRIVRCTLRANQTTEDGGAIFVVQGNPKFVECVVRDNVATNRGGGACLGYRSEAVFDGCVFRNNRAMLEAQFAHSLGHGRHSDAARWSAISRIPRAEPYLFRITASRAFRTASSRKLQQRLWGCVWVGCESIRFANCTISDNAAASWCGGIANEGNEIELSDCIVWGNRDPGGMQEYAQLSPFSYDSIHVRYSCIQNLSEITGAGNFDADPRFVQPGVWEAQFWLVGPSAYTEGDYHLLADSSCIDAGDPGISPDQDETDLDGDPRVVGPRVDVGSDEFSGTALPKK